MRGSPGMRAPSPLSARSTASRASRRPVCQLSMPRSCLVEGVRKSMDRRAAGLTVTRCAAIGRQCLRTACSRSTWPRLQRQVKQRRRPTSEASMDEATLTAIKMDLDSRALRERRKTTKIREVISAIKRLQTSDSRKIKCRSLGA